MKFSVELHNELAKKLGAHSAIESEIITVIV
jgi:hypothetical protein